MLPVKLIDIFCFRARVIKTERYNKTKKLRKKLDKQFFFSFFEVRQIY